MLKLSLFLHLTAAIFWIGGMLFLTLIVGPFLMTLEPKERSRVYRFVGQRYKVFGWAAIAVLLITGPLNLHLMGVSLSSLFDGSFHSSRYGMAIMVKLLLVAAIVVSSLIHDFYLGPKARTDRKYSSVARRVGRLNLLIAMLIVLFATFIRLGGV